MMIRRLNLTDASGAQWSLDMDTEDRATPFIVRVDGKELDRFPKFGQAKREIMQECATVSHWDRIQGGCL